MFMYNRWVVILLTYTKNGNALSGKNLNKIKVLKFFSHKTKQYIK